MNPLESLTKWAFLAVSLPILLTALTSCSSSLDPFQEPSCRGVDCSGHGECEIQGGKAVCVCDFGYHAEGLDCLEDANLCEGIDCSGHGRCVVQSGQPACECDPGYVPIGQNCELSCNTSVDCDDSNACTEDLCLVEGYCVYEVVADATNCDDGDACTVGDLCSSGKCASGPRVDCNGTSDQCRRDDPTCDPTGSEGNCDIPGVPINEGVACDDGNTCTIEDACSQGECLGVLIDEDGDGIPPESCGGMDCDDGNPSITGETEIWMGSGVCTNGLDDDCDGMSDAEETDCALPMVCDQGGWCIDNPFALPRGGQMLGAEALWGSSANDVWAVGRDIYHFDGHYWELIRHDSAWQISGSSETNVWIPVGCCNGDLYHWDGGTWTTNNGLHDVLPPDVGRSSTPIKSIWTTSSSDVWLNLGSDNANNSYIAHWNGLTWSISFSITGSDVLRGIGGSGPDDVWSVGEKIVHWDGHTWEIVESSPGATLHSVYAWDTDNAWAVGENGTILHWNGTEWIHQDFGTLCYTKIWGLSPDNMYLCGIDDSDARMILHWNGTEWSTEIMFPSNGFSYCDIWGASEDNIWALAQQSFTHWDGNSWTVFPTSPTTTEDLKYVYAVDNSNVWAIGNSTVLYRDGIRWIDVSSDLSGQYNNAVWAASPDDAWVVGEQGHIAHWNGTTWTVVDSGTSSSLNSIWGSSADSIWAVGGSGTIVHWDGNLWTSIESGTEETLLEVHGSSDANVWVGGENHIVLQWNGLAWSDMDFFSDIDPDPRCGETIYDLVVFSQDDIWMQASCFETNSKGSPYFDRLYHWNGSQWSIMKEKAGGYGGFSIAGSVPDNLWLRETFVSLISTRIEITVWDGSKWLDHRIPGPPVIGSSLAVTEQGSAITVGSGGRILRYQGCRTDEDCIDSNICMVNRECVDGFCAGGTPAPEGSSCDDHTFCNGADTCDANGKCSVHSGDPCGGQTCNEDEDVCQ